MPDVTALGRRVTEFERLETFACPECVHCVEMTSQEFTAVCPVTGQPDWYEIEITYAPKAVCLESKTLKLYLQQFRNEGSFCEQLADRICKDIYKALDPWKIEVMISQRPRGGVAIVAEARIDA